jgi:hypothetical protein
MHLSLQPVALTLYPTLQRYFDSLNSGDFQATSQLFATDGMLHPPFESAIVGPEAIATYLEAEARDLQLMPRKVITQSIDEEYTEIQVTGTVQTPLFSVNVGWLFVLNQQDEIALVQVKLLAALQELLGLKRN